MKRTPPFLDLEDKVWHAIEEEVASVRGLETEAVQSA